MKIKDIRGMSEKDLMAKLDEIEKELIKLGGQISTGTQLKSPGQVKQLKRTRAQIKTVLNNEELKKHE